MKPSPAPFERANQSPLAILRRDLSSVCLAGKTRVDRLVIDEIAGRFTRVSDHVWKRLQHGDADPGLWHEARAAGWTRERIGARPNRFNLLAIRIPLGSIDGWARRLAPYAAPVFSRSAIVAWTWVMIATVVLVINRHEEFAAALRSLPMFLQQSGFWWTTVVFAVTKLIHELAHGVMCRRMGARCGGFGLLLLCGIPCPYCDVTDIWRTPSAAKRMGVMLAGIYVELILATIAGLVWMLAFDPGVRLFAVQVMVICGISTLMFNANPLMRYDGYYVLSDLIGSTNLRREGQEAFAAAVTSRLAGRNFAIPRRSDPRSLWMSIYHAAATGYRGFVLLAIATFMLTVADVYQVRSLAMLGIVMVAARLSLGFGNRIRGVLGGRGCWEHVPSLRRGFVVTLIVLSCLTLVLIPVPRFRRVAGTLDAASARNVYFSSPGMVTAVLADFGDLVESGQTLVELQNDSLSIAEARSAGQWNVAKLRSDLSRRSTLATSRREDSPAMRRQDAMQWPALQAAEQAAHAQLVSLQNRLAQTKVSADVRGVVLPCEANVANASPITSLASLHESMGKAAHVHTPWCRISADGRLYAVLILDARDREQIGIGSPVRLGLTGSPGVVVTSQVVSVSELHPETSSATRPAAYQVLCPFPLEHDAQLLSLLGAPCEGVFSLPRERLLRSLANALSRWAKGE